MTGGSPTLGTLLLVTGAAGWLGRRLVHLARHRFPDRPIRAMLLPGTEADLGDAAAVESISGDLRSPEDCGRFCTGAAGATLLHCAGVIHPKRVREFYEINVAGTRNLLDAAGSQGVRRVVAVSSNSPLGCNPHPDHLFDEGSPYHPYVNYGRSKMLMELEVKSRHDRGALEAVIVRAPWFYGPGQPLRQTAFFQMIRQGRVPIVGSGANMRSMAYVDNLAEGILLAAESERARGQVYWIADAEPYSMNQIVDTVERLLEREFGLAVAHKRLRLPHIVGEVATWVDRAWQTLGQYDQRLHVLSEMNKTIACSVRKAREELGYEPRIALEEGMRRSIRWSLDEGHAL